MSATAAILKVPAALALDYAGNVCVADAGNNRLRKVAPGGAIDAVAAALSALTGLAFDTYIAGSTAYRISYMTSDGTTTPYAGTVSNSVSAAPVPRGTNELDDPVAVAADSFGCVYIADPIGRLHRITSNCVLSKPYAGAVSGVASDAQDNIYFSDPQHSVVWGLPAAPPPRRRGRHAKPGLRRLHQRCQLADV
jgi:hypothetical protein